MGDLTVVLPWVAISVLSVGFFAQIFKIWKHKEVRDLSWVSYVAWAIGYFILGYEAYLIDSPIFMFKNGLTFILVIILLSQIRFHWNDEWHDSHDRYCICSNEMEPQWNFCPDCGASSAHSDLRRSYE